MTLEEIRRDPALRRERKVRVIIAAQAREGSTTPLEHAQQA